MFHVRETSTLQQAVQAADEEALLFPLDQPNTLVRDGGVIGNTHTIAHTQAIPAMFNTSLVDASSQFRFDDTPIIGIVYNIILLNNSSEEVETEINPANMGFLVGGVYVNGSHVVSGNYDYIYTPSNGFLWVQALLIDNKLFITTK